jgi:hypothetical protein
MLCCYPYELFCLENEDYTVLSWAFVAEALLPRIVGAFYSRTNEEPEPVLLLI